MRERYAEPTDIVGLYYIVNNWRKQSSSHHTDTEVTPF